MTTPEPVSPEVRRSPDGRLIAYCRSARHGLWRKSDGYDCEAEDVADWTPLVPVANDQSDWDSAVDWLINSRHIEMAVHTHFFHLSNGQECDCDLD